MPPNRKAELSAEDIPTLNVAQLKLQLRAPADASAAQKPPSTNQEAYWDWPADAEIQRQQTQDLFSVAHIQQNLVRDAHARQAKSMAVTQSSSRQNHDKDYYWDMPSAPPQESEVPAALFRHLQTVATITSEAATPQSYYWDWPLSSEHEEAGLQRVLDGQRARRLTSATTYEAQLTKQQQQQPTQSSKPCLVAAHDAYWIF